MTKRLPPRRLEPSGAGAEGRVDLGRLSPPTPVPIQVLGGLPGPLLPRRLRIGCADCGHVWRLIPLEWPLRSIRRRCTSLGDLPRVLHPLGLGHLGRPVLDWIDCSQHLQEDWDEVAVGARLQSCFPYAGEEFFDPGVPERRHFTFRRQARPAQDVPLVCVGLLEIHLPSVARFAVDDPVLLVPATAPGVLVETCSNSASYQTL
jgi:hypothetical protein